MPADWAEDAVLDPGSTHASPLTALYARSAVGYAGSAAGWARPRCDMVEVSWARWCSQFANSSVLRLDGRVNMAGGG